MAWDGEKALDFDSPTAAPVYPDQHDRWQRANRSWWEAHPMRYDWRQPVRGAQGELDWFRADEEFLVYARDLCRSIGAILFGRRTYQMMAAYWPTV